MGAVGAAAERRLEMLSSGAGGVAHASEDVSELGVADTPVCCAVRGRDRGARAGSSVRALCGDTPP